MKIIETYFSSIEDFRIEKKCFHKLSDILFIGLTTFLSGGEDYVDMVLFAETHEDFLRDYISLPNGIPSHDTFNRVFSTLEPKLLGQCLHDYGWSFGRETNLFWRQKTQGSFANKGLYIVNAWVAENRICIGQQKVEDKSNEMTAIPLLIEDLDITDAVVSIDAIGCQREIAEQIVDKGGHYLLSLKENQQELYLWL